MFFIRSDTAELIPWVSKEPVPFPTVRIRQGELTDAGALVVFRYEDPWDYFNRGRMLVGIIESRSQAQQFLVRHFAETGQTLPRPNPSPWITNEGYKKSIDLGKRCWRGQSIFPSCLSDAI